MAAAAILRSIALQLVSEQCYEKYSIEQDYLNGKSMLLPST